MRCGLHAWMALSRMPAEAAEKKTSSLSKVDGEAGSTRFPCLGPHHCIPIITSTASWKLLPETDTEERWQGMATYFSPFSHYLLEWHLSLQILRDRGKHCIVFVYRKEVVSIDHSRYMFHDFTVTCMFEKGKPGQHFGLWAFRCRVFDDRTFDIPRRCHAFENDYTNPGNDFWSWKCLNFVTLLAKHILE